LVVKAFKITLVILITVALFLRMCLGIFVIQPINAEPDGATVVYWRLGTSFYFIESNVGIVSIDPFGETQWLQLVEQGLFNEPILEREIFRMPYSNFFYVAASRRKIKL